MGMIGVGMEIDAYHGTFLGLVMAGTGKEEPQSGGTAENDTFFAERPQQGEKALAQRQASR